ncbi:MAG TPA: hypothetical protein VFM93_00105 [Candidatus Limnocylindria bacterium]|nr:hypothetical protein [Candidatus Limnocylindria bacterium]
MFDLTPREVALLRRLNTPDKIQKYLDGLMYNLEKDGESLRSPRRVIRDRTAHCAEAAFFAAAALRVQGRPPLVIDLEAVRDDDHVLALYRERGLWGAVALSKFAGLRYRAPVHRTLRELVMSYFEDYYNWDGERTLRAYSRPVSLARFDRIGWMTSEDDLWPIVDHLARIPHIPLLPPGTDRRLVRLDPRSYRSGLVGAPPH